MPKKLKRKTSPATPKKDAKKAKIDPATPTKTESKDKKQSKKDQAKLDKVCGKISRC
jgi:hypothetical protein